MENMTNITNQNSDTITNINGGKNMKQATQQPTKAKKQAEYFGIDALLSYYTQDEIDETLNAAFEQSFKLQLAGSKPQNHEPGIYAQELADLILRNAFVNASDGYIYTRNDAGIFVKFFLNSKFEFAAITNKLLFGKSQTICDGTAKRLSENLTRNIAPNSIIQFNDCYIGPSGQTHSDGQRIDIYEGIFDGPPRYVLSYDMLEVYNSREIKAPKSQEVEDLLLHIANYDGQMKEYLTKILSTMFMNDHKTKQSFSSMMVNIYGETGENGKSTFINLLTETLNTADKYRNCCSTSLSTWSKPEYLYSVVNSLIAVDADSSASTLNNAASEVVKKVVTGDSLTVKLLYSQPEEVTPSTLVVTASNTDIKSWDKSNGWNRRILKLDVQRKLEKPNEWFNHLFSQDSYAYLIQKLFITFIELLESGKKPEEPQVAKDLRNEYKLENNSALAFANDITIEEVTNKSIVLLYNQYKIWCRDENDSKPLARITFKAAISEVFDVVAESKAMRPISDKLLHSSIADGIVSPDFVGQQFKNADGFNDIDTSIYRYQIVDGFRYIHGPKCDVGGNKKVQFFVETENIKD